MHLSHRLQRIDSQALKYLHMRGDLLVSTKVVGLDLQYFMEIIDRRPVLLIEMSLVVSSEESSL